MSLKPMDRGVMMQKSTTSKQVGIQYSEGKRPLNRDLAKHNLRLV